ncbi:cytochrome P450 [Streptomyces sp. MS06]|uniref:cytochrome P450 n=1 Tax=Streptomyces sp. MS06 TaxID=3385974 RepID=UPI0039A0EBC4
MTAAPEASTRPRPATTGVAPGGLPLLGHALRLRNSPLDFLASLPAHGDLVEVRLGPRRAYLACHPEVVLQVLHQARLFDKGGPLFDKLRLLTGNGLVSSPWEEHRRHRRLMQPAFRADRMDGYAALMSEEIESMLGSWRAGTALDVGEALRSLTARITVRTLFSGQIDDRAVAEVQRLLPVFTEGLYRRMVAPLGWTDLLPTPENRRFTRARVRMRAVIGRAVRDHLASGEDRGDLLSLLADLTDEEIHDQVMTVLLGGTETTASALGWAFHCLSANPEAERRLHEEVDTVLGGRSPGLEDVPRLDFTRRVLTEVLRLYPPAWLLTRVTTGEAELVGRRLPPGTLVLFSPYSLGRDPASFPDPERFDPDRWLPERARSVPRGALVPFGAGSRKCIGDDFGLVEATLVVAAVAARLRLVPRPGTRVRPVPRAALATGPLPMTPVPRGPGGVRAEGAER